MVCARDGGFVYINQSSLYILYTSASQPGGPGYIIGGL
jgi:hypothetical protein